MATGISLDDIVKTAESTFDDYLRPKQGYFEVRGDLIEMQILAIDYLITEGKFNRDDELVANSCSFKQYWRMSELELGNLLLRCRILVPFSGKADMIRQLVPPRQRKH